MKFYSTNGQSPPVPLRQAVVQGLAPDGGLYLPEQIPQLPPAFFRQLGTQSLPDIAYAVARPFLAEEVPPEVLRPLLEEVLDFPIPLVAVEEGIYSLELYRGPTAAFKDVGARFMARLLAYLTRNESRELRIVVATSGDTGSAVAAGFFGVPGIRVYLLYPKGKVSPLQQKQLTTWGGNITALEVEGTFDDCQQLAKLALADRELNQRQLLSSANSINIARLIPQSFYYFWALAQLQQPAGPVVFSVPSGNFGNLTGGLMAAAMGLPVQRFIAATNANDIVPHYLRSGQYQPRPSVATLSNAMDVGNPSNYARLAALYQHQHARFCQQLSGYSFSDAETRQAIRRLWEDRGYLLDPHGAIGYLGLKQYQAEQGPGHCGIFLETAHPAKFREVVEAALDQPLAIPAQLAHYLQKAEQQLPMRNEFDSLKQLLLV
ncbi:threonine synthase [Cesiribacter andamanensis]|uniref:Threonine synthase n=1 Tax=Cesiribacter andamanensis AMV16 TaxID=1279009 RepID=M7N0H1_9BACT|nr:threonine synthase [Cesiribacter andamanensis]EMR00716.1 Threonine synthase [Cesiribacter andamanensis AMV16]